MKLMSIRLRVGLSFRDGPKDQTSDVRLHIGESRDSGFDASHRPGMTVDVDARPAITDQPHQIAANFTLLPWGAVGPILCALAKSGDSWIAFASLAATSSTASFQSRGR